MQRPNIKEIIDFRASFEKQHATKKINGTYNASKIERRFGDALKTMFGSQNVECQVRVNTWTIDFYVSTLDTYVQFDGMYWHGLDRPIETIRMSQTTRDKTIAKSYDKDVVQNKWFETHGLRLVRITEREFKENTIKAIQKVMNDNS